MSHCGSHTLQSTWKSLTVVLKLNYELPRRLIDRAPAVFDLHIHCIHVHRVAVQSIRTGELI